MGKMEPIGRKRWAIAEGDMPSHCSPSHCSPSQSSPSRSSPSRSSFSYSGLVCHETARILNAGDRDARARVTVFFVDRESVGPCDLTVTARRTLHLRFNDLKDAAPIPCTDYASVFEPDVPIVLSNTRDSFHVMPSSSLLSTMAYAQT